MNIEPHPRAVGWGIFLWRSTVIDEELAFNEPGEGLEEKKPAKKKPAPRKKKVVKVPLEDIMKIRIVDQEGVEFILVPLRFGNYRLTPADR
jgi:hypothetical protein